MAPMTEWFASTSMTNGLSRRGFLRALPLPDILLTEDAANPDGLLYRWKAPRSFKQRKGGLRELGPTDGVLGACAAPTEPRPARRPGLVLRPQAPDADPEAALRRQPEPRPGRRVRRPGQHHRLPWGGLILAEDGEGVQHLVRVTEGGESFPLARNELGNGSEFTGPVYSNDKKVLFGGLQTPGIMFAITGPWKNQS